MPASVTKNPPRPKPRVEAIVPRHSNPAPTPSLSVPTSPRFLSFSKLPQVMARVALKRACIYTLIAKGLFPKQVVLTADQDGNPTSVAWLDSDIDAWMEQRVAASRAAQQQQAEVRTRE